MEMRKIVAKTPSWLKQALIDATDTCKRDVVEETQSPVDF